MGNKCYICGSIISTHGCNCITWTGTSTSSSPITWISNPIEKNTNIPNFIIGMKNDPIPNDDFTCTSCNKKCDRNDLEMIYKKIGYMRMICKECVCDKMDAMFGIKMKKESLLFKK